MLLRVITLQHFDERHGMTVQTGLRRAGGKSVLGYLDPVSQPGKGGAPSDCGSTGVL